MATIKKIDYTATFSVRHPVLRAGRPIESCFFDGDELETTFHFGLFVVDKLVGVISVFKNKTTTFSVAKQFQIRGMAVLKEHQSFGYGKLLLQKAEEEIIKQKGGLIWFNARENAVGFYQNSGYQIVGNSFEIAGIGTHYIMYKKIGQ
jgi:ribosomal protein S18 acetylase RimI-like enzyme